MWLFLLLLWNIYSFTNLIMLRVVHMCVLLRVVLNCCVHVTDMTDTDDFLLFMHVCSRLVLFTNFFVHSFNHSCMHDFFSCFFSFLLLDLKHILGFLFEEKLVADFFCGFLSLKFYIYFLCKIFDRWWKVSQSRGLKNKSFVAFTFSFYHKLREWNVIISSKMKEMKYLLYNEKFFNIFLTRTYKVSFL